MKSKLLVILAFVVAGIISIAAPTAVAANAMAASQTPPVLVILGDSIGAGYGVNANQNYGAICAANGYEVRNRAINSARTAGQIDRDMVELLTGNTSLALATQADVAAADIINITIGGNDLQGIDSILGSGYLRGVVAECNDVNNTEKVMLSETIDYLVGTTTIILDRIIELNPDALIVVFKNYCPPYHTPGLLGGLMVSLMFGTTNYQSVYAGADYAINQVNERVWGTYLEANPGSFVFSDSNNAVRRASDNKTNPSLFQSDLIHPTAAGHAILANILMETISENVRAVSLSAYVTKLTGNKNDLTITVNELRYDGNIITLEQTFKIDNNAEGTYKVGAYNIYVNTKGNVQIRDLKLAA